MTGQLVVVRGPETGKVFPVSENRKYVIGRGQTADLQVGDPHISRVHCEIELQQGRLQLRDSGSTGGTYVDGHKTETATLESGQCFVIGGTELRVDLATSAGDTTVRLPAGSKGAIVPLRQLVGQVLNKFHLDAIIAEGSDSTVFEATDTETNEKVAFKVLVPDPSQSDEQKERFVRAMKAMLPIQHPNIVRVLYAGKNGPYCWTAMEYVDGESLERVIERIGIRGMIDWPVAFRVAVDICRALSESYQQKIVHRNLTPKNILRRHADKVCMLSDLMLAKATEGVLSKQVTQAGQIIGTLSYIAPECTTGDGVVDHRSDLYGLGATLYALLTGRPPFVSKSMAELVQMIRDQAPKPPKEFQLAINDSFQNIVLELLQKRPEDRYQTPRDLMRDLELVAKFTGQKIS